MNQPSVPSTLPPGMSRFLSREAGRRGVSGVRGAHPLGASRVALDARKARRSPPGHGACGALRVGPPDPGATSRRRSAPKRWALSARIASGPPCRRRMVSPLEGTFFRVSGSVEQRPHGTSRLFSLRSGFSSRGGLFLGKKGEERWSSPSLFDPRTTDDSSQNHSPDFSNTGSLLQEEKASSPASRSYDHPAERDSIKSNVFERGGMGGRKRSPERFLLPSPYFPPSFDYR